MAVYNFQTTGDEIATNCAAHVENKTILVTGVTPGSLGAGFVIRIAKYRPRLIILASRNVSKAEKTARDIVTAAPEAKTRILELDLGSQDQIRKAALEVNAYQENIDVLVNSAGVMAVPYGVTKEGIESQFGTNHIGHFLFTNLIMPKLRASEYGGRVLIVASDGCRLGPVRFDDWNFDNGKTYDKWRAYGQAKSANMLFAVSLAQKLGKKGLLAASMHPGVISTNLGDHLSEEHFKELAQIDRDIGNRSTWDGFTWKTMDQGVATYVFGAFDPSVLEHNGSFLSDSQVVPPTQVWCWGRDPVDAERLWKLSEKLVGQQFEY
ncbi:hypothetical protein AJ80_00636 [Polytolypa hystricis UAMH7299]|uniref:Oxidoreductase n=1 Tax=Polytolypa hystricis (strain UAMH7299) TaxID=1447883 RepID=A0A2B7Z319_POLH7|nr:hypothetical protein AJ80_00636 [Polytolypa hystricis UAMH7299]